MQCAIIVHKMCVEERDVIETDYGLNSDEKMSGIIVDGRVSPMLCGLVWPHGPSCVPP